MDGTQLAGWLVALGTLALVWVAIRSERKAVRKEAEERPKLVMVEVVKPINETMQRFAQQHEQHFADARKLSLELVAVQQQISDHERTCTERGTRIEDMFREIRDDVKTIMRARP